MPHSSFKASRRREKFNHPLLPLLDRWDAWAVSTDELSSGLSISAALSSGDARPAGAIRERQFLLLAKTSLQWTRLLTWAHALRLRVNSAWDHLCCEREKPPRRIVQEQTDTHTQTLTDCIAETDSLRVVCSSESYFISLYGDLQQLGRRSQVASQPPQLTVLVT